VGYLEAEQNRCIYEEKTKIINVFKDFILKTFNDVMNNKSNDFSLPKNQSVTYNFITFNYTNVLDNILNLFLPSKEIQRRNYHTITLVDKIGKICHVHGVLDSSNIIMGVNDETQLNLSGGVTLSEDILNTLIKPQINTQYRSNWDTNCKDIIINSNIIAIYGVSFGITDNIWWKEVVKWLKSNRQNKLIVFYRNPSQNINKLIPPSKLRIENDLKKELLLKLGTDKNDTKFTELLSQVYIIFNTTRLNLKDLIHLNVECDYMKA